MLPRLPDAKYKAFISYSHADEKWAKWLHKSLETYVVHKRLVGLETEAGTVPAKLAPVFRDRDELASATDLSSTINQALAQSSALLVICSPSSAKSHWVNEEILAFKRMGGEHRIFCLIAAGEPYASSGDGSGPEECFPAAVRYQLGEDGELSSNEAEPIASDVRPGKDGRENAKLKLIAGLLGVGFDDLRQREAQRRQRRMALIASASVAGMVVTSGLAAAALLARNEAEEQRRIAIVEAEKARQTTDFLVQLFSVSDPGEARGNTITAREILDKAARRIENELANQPEIQAALTGTIGEVYTSLGLYQQAIPLLETSLQNRRALEGISTPELTESLNRIAHVATEQAEYPRAEQLYLESIELLQGSAAKDELAESYAGLAELYFRMGKYEKAQPLLQDVLSLRAQFFGPETPEVADATEELGLSHFDLGNLEEAEKLLTQALNLRRKIYRDSIHPDLAENLNNLASLYYRQGELEKARDLFTESLTMSRKLLGDVHPDLAGIYNNLAFLHHDRQELETAETMYREALNQQQKIYGEEHPKVARSYNNLAYLVHDRGQEQQALEMVEKALQIARATLGEHHKDVATYSATLGRWLGDSGNYARSIALLRESLQLKSEFLEDEHPSLLVTKFDLTESLLGAEELDEAQQLAYATYNFLLNSQNSESWLALTAEGLYGELLSRTGQLEQGESLLLDSYTGLSKDESVRPVFVKKALQRLVAHYRRTGVDTKVKELEAELLAFSDAH
ncbi:tetratricopeptide repeat protein [Microbulbifer sp. SA54]|uniref:tetratricopeptide repeat protein n=1 Tax=Microbulbifer sp. SA54 TaxID=3401577 RepID=UPI003AAB0ABB